MQHDPSEKYNLAGHYPEIMKEIEEMVLHHQARVEVLGSQVEKRKKVLLKYAFLYFKDHFCF